MQRNQLWIFLGIGLMFGLSMEVLKTAGPDQDRLARLARLQEIAADSAPLYRPVAQKQKSIRVAIKNPTEMNAALGGLTATDAAPTPTGTAAQAAGTSNAKAKALAEKKKKEEEAKKKKKQKKKKKIKGKKDEEETPEETTPEEAQPEGGAVEPVGGAWNYPNSLNNNGGRQTVAEWEAYLLGQPDFKRTGELVRAFKSGQITADVFYEVVESLLSDSRPRMRELGVTALGSTESARSFAYLAEFNRTEREKSTRLMAQKYLAMYTRLDYLHHLKEALNVDSDLNTQKQALSVLAKAADMHLKSSNQGTEQSQDQPGNGGTPGNVGNPPGNTGNPTQPGQPADDTRKPAGSATRYFDPFVKVLGNLSVLGQDQNVRQSATQTLSRLRTLIAMAST